MTVCSAFLIRLVRKLMFAKISYLLISRSKGQSHTRSLCRLLRYTRSLCIPRPFHRGVRLILIMLTLVLIIFISDGSIGINLINGDTLPTLHFHDDESHSFTLHSPSPRRSSSVNGNVTPYPPPPTQGTSHVQKPITSWGGEDLLSRLRNYAHLLRSTLQPSLFLVDPSRADIEAHSTQIFPDDAVDDILGQSPFANSHSPIPAHRRPRPLSANGAMSSSLHNPYAQGTSVLHRSLGTPPASSSQSGMALLQSFSNITRATRHAAQNILSHPLAKPILPHLPDPVKSLVNADGSLEWGSWVEKGGVGEFESARVYLARWARIVAEEGERARRQEAQALLLSSESYSAEEEASSLGIFELLRSTANLPTPKTTRETGRPVDDRVWKRWFDDVGRPTVTMGEMKKEVFRRGISSKGGLRQRVWPYLLGVFEWDSTADERERLWDEKRYFDSLIPRGQTYISRRKRYQAIKDEWCGVPEVFDSQKVLEVRSMTYLRLRLVTIFRQERHRIDVDCRRTDRNQPMFSAPAQIPTIDVDDGDLEAKEQHYSIISPTMNDIGAQSPSNEHVDRMTGILLTYNFYEKELGMLSPLFCWNVPFILYRICPRDVRPLCPDLCCHEWQRGDDFLVLRGGYEQDGKFSFLFMHWFLMHYL